MLTILRQAFSLLTGYEKRKISVTLLLSSIAAIVQALSVLSLLPFIILLASPSALETNAVLSRLYDFTGAQSYPQFLILFGVLTVILLALGNLFLAYEHWVSYRFICELRHRLEQRLMGLLLRQPYKFFLHHKSAQLGDIVISQVERVVEGVIGTLIAVVTNSILAGFIVSLLLIISFESTIATLLALVLTYLCVFLLLKRKIEQHGEELTVLSGTMLGSVKETLDGIREIQTRRAERFFEEKFGRSSFALSDVSLRHGMLSFLPYFFLETLIFTGLISVALYFALTSEDVAVSLGLIAVYGIAIYRLVPSLQLIFDGLAELHLNADALRLVEKYLHLQPDTVGTEALASPQHQLRLMDVSYQYDSHSPSELSAIDLTIPVGSSLCLLGASGAGKSTLLNIIAGLVPPTQGQLLVDDCAIGPETLHSWRGMIGYISQQVFLFDDTIAGNIAFGIPRNEIDETLLNRAIAIANLNNLVAGLKDGVWSDISENGRNLSGGERQRIGIARAVYHMPAVLVLDEALSSLDSKNRSVILKNLFALKNVTLIFASHLPEVADHCAEIAIIEDSKISLKGSYRALLENLPYCPAYSNQIKRFCSPKISGSGYHHRPK